MLVSTIPTSLWNLHDLLVLSLSANFLNGSLPPEIAKLKVVTLMNLSTNLLSGDVPTSIGGLESLIYLYLDHNNLQGSIPESLKNMFSLEELDLSHNNLSGVIPKSLEALLHLRKFNVSFNKLTGEIPNGRPFANLNSTSFISNEALCGKSRFSISACHTSTGSEGLVSPFCDVYSYGIMLMEIFTKTKPSDDKFTGNLSLKQWIYNSMPDELIKVIDADLLRPGEEYFTQKLQSLSSVLELALSCCAESPKERMNMKDVIATLKKIKLQILPHSGRP